MRVANKCTNVSKAEVSLVAASESTTFFTRKITMYRSD